MNAQLTIIREIDNAIAQSSVDRRAQMARHLTDLFLVNSDKYSDIEIALIDDVFVRLVVTIEESSRALLASRLGPMSKAPPKVLRALACDDAIFVASSVLMHSEGLDNQVLIECAKTKSQDHLFAISRRKILPETVTDILVERGDQQVALSTAQNVGAKFSDKGLTILVKRAHGNDELAICVGNRPELPPELFGQLLEAASDAVRSKLKAESPHVVREIDGVVIDVTSRIRTQAKIQSQEYAAAQVLVDLLKRAGQLNATRLEAFAKADRYEETISALAALSGLSTAVVVQKLNGNFVQFIVILAKAIDLPWPETRTILMLGCRKNRCTLSDIENGQIEFQRLKQQTALQILAVHRTNGRTRAK